MSATLAVTAELARWVTELTFAKLPDVVITHAKDCLLDSLGCGLYGAQQPWGRIAADTAIAMGKGKARLFGRYETVGPADAALANGTAIHGFELDDIHVASSYHPGAVTVASCLASADQSVCSGADFLVALVAGYEVGIRTGICAGVRHSTSGYHVTGTVGTLGASAAAARLLALDAEATLNALGIGGTQACGLYSARKGAMTKRLHAGCAARAGVLAANLAAHGFTGSSVVLEAPFGGFMSTLQGESEPTTILEGLGADWETLRVGFKAYASCASTHTIIDALDDLMAQGLTAETLERLIIRMSRKGFTNVGWRYKPADVVAAQMNGYYTAAVKLTDGEVFVEQFEETRLADPRILKLIPRIEIVHDPVLDEGGPTKRHAVTLNAWLRDGRTLHCAIEQRRGSFQRPLSALELETKFSRVAGSIYPVPVVEEIEEIIRTLELQANISRLVDLLSTEAIKPESAEVRYD